MAGLNGRSGLAALLSRNNANNSTQNNESEGFVDIDINKLHKGKYQPRKDIDAETLKELSLSIASQGIIQPIIVRKLSENDYEIIAGERRWQAAKLAGLKDVPCIVKTIDDKDAISIALIENIQREDLNIIEQAEALLSLSKELNLTHEELAKTIGKSRSSISNIIRLNDLNNNVKELVRRSELEMGHARALLAIPYDEQEKLSLIIVQKGLTVRETESLVKSYLNPKEIKERKINDTYSSYSEILSSRLDGCEVNIIEKGKDKGKFVLSFKNKEEFEKIKAFFNL